METVAPFRLLRRVQAWAKSAPQRPAYVEAQSGRVLTYLQLFRAIERLRSNLNSCLKPGETVILQCGNRIEFAIWFLAVLSNGGRACLVHPDLTQAQVQRLCDRLRALGVVGDCRSENPTLLQWRIDSALDVTATETLPPINAGPMLLASSGTTGEPKIVQRSAASLDSVAEAMVDAIGFTEADQILAAVPLSHSYGIEHGLLAPLWAGSTVHLCDGFDLAAMSELLHQRITIFPAVPSMIEMLSTLADAPRAMARLRVAYSAGGALASPVHKRFAERFGVRVGQVYGMTEIGSVTFNNPSRSDFDPTSVGRPLRGVSVRILDAVDGQIAIRAPSMLEQYIDEPTQFIDGYFPTGDLGHVSADGDLFVTGRSRLLIDVGGLKVNPLEVEAVLCAHPGVRECAVVSFRQSETILRLRAIVVPIDSAAPPPIETLRSWVRNQLSRFKVPRMIEFREALPRSAAGKVLRAQLEAESCED